MPRGKQYLPRRMIGTVCRDIDAVTVPVSFFKDKRASGYRGPQGNKLVSARWQEFLAPTSPRGASPPFKLASPTGELLIPIFKGLPQIVRLLR